MWRVPIFSKSRESDHPLGVAQSGRMGRKIPEMNELEHLLSKTPELLTLRQVWTKLETLKVARKSENLSEFGCQIIDILICFVQLFSFLRLRADLQQVVHTAEWT